MLLLATTLTLAGCATAGPARIVAQQVDFIRHGQSEDNPDRGQPVVIPNKSAASPLILSAGKTRKPFMPPKDEEPLNPQDNHANYYLNRTSEAFDIVREVASPFVKILFDIYHVQIMEGNLIDTIRKNIAHISHFHVGDVPGRHEPGTGEIHYSNVFKAIRAAGFRDFVAMEYVPAKDAMVTLAEVQALAN